MPAPKWNRLDKIGSRDIYQLEPDKDPQVGSETFKGVNFSQFTFDDAEERLLATDTRGYVYQLELRGAEDVTWKKFEKLGLATSLAFNPLDKSEILVASTSNDIKIYRFGNEKFSLPVARLSGHRCPVSHMSFHKGFYCLSASVKEAIIWDLRTCAKLHQLCLKDAGAKLKKSAFASSGLIAALYSSDALQIWPFQTFNDESRVSLSPFGVRNVKDFIFTRDARAIIICAARGGIIVLDTTHFQLVARLNMPDNLLVPKRLAIIPRALDTGANRILAISCADGSLQFMDLGKGTFVQAQLGPWLGIRNFAVSAQGRWLACVEVNGNLVLGRTDKMFLEKEELGKKRKPPGKSCKAHHASQHLRSIEEDVREELRLCRLLPILKEFGEYPSKHRIVIWRTIMQLPSNRDACTALIEKTSQEASVRDVLDEYPLADRSKASLLASTVDRLVRWCPLLGQCQFLPSLVFPFLLVFQKDPLLALEGSITIISNFCQKWFEYHPLPPLNVLGIVENVLLESDPTLLTHFCERGITSTDYAWPLLRTALSEVLAANEWLVLWDHILTSKRPSLLLMCVVAYSISSRATIISLLRKPADFRRFYATQGNVGIKELLKVARRLDSNTPERIHPNRYLRDDFVVLPSEGPYPPFLMHEYPKFLTDEQSDVAQFRHLKEEEILLREYRQQAVKNAEEKRLCTESENFVKEIHRNRMAELRKCYEEQLRITKFNVANAREEIHKSASGFGETASRSMEFYRPRRREESSSISSRSRRSTPSRSDSCKELGHQVQKLESEVQQFLSGLRTKSSVDIS